MAISKAEILMGREVEYPLTSEMEFSLAVLLQRVNKLRGLWGRPMQVTSGYRPGKYNRATVGAAPKSKHMTCQAVDFYDPTRSLGLWLLSNQHILVQCELFLEHPYDTCNEKTAWVHVQTVPPPSGARVFRVKPTIPMV